MNCADARHLIHLDAGGDLCASEEHQLAEHLERCSECRGYNASMVKAMQALHVLREFDSVAASTARGGVDSSLNGNSAWGAISSRLPVRQRRPVSMRQFNTRVAALCACSLVLAMVTIVQNLPSSQFTTMSDSGAAPLYNQFPQAAFPVQAPVSFQPAPLGLPVSNVNPVGQKLPSVRAGLTPLNEPSF